MEVAVIGGGIVGVAAAYSLAERGAEVALFERDSLGSGSTTRAVGGIRTQFSTPVNVDLSLASIDVWETFEERFGVDFAYRQHGYLFLARESATATQFRENARMQRERGVAVQTLSPAEAREHCPGLDPDPFELATYSPRDGYADPNLALQGYVGGARDAGVEIHTNTSVDRLQTKGGRVVGVVVDGEQETFDRVVNAAGAWSRTLAATVGVELPIAPRRRQVAVVEPAAPVPETDPLTIDLDTGSHFRPEREGRALVGGHFDGQDPDVDPDQYDDDLDLEWAVNAVERAGEYTNYFGPETRIRRGWAGLYAVTPDHHPVLAEVKPGLVVAAGFSGHGFQHAPATGQVVAELCLDGEASLVDVSALSLKRFEDGSELVERNVA